METLWYHCRACGEEGLVPGDERCPHCGIRAPVILCDACQRPIREEKPWTLRVSPSPPGRQESNRPYQFHRVCYGRGKRSLIRDQQLSDQSLIKDSRDLAEPLTPARWLLGVGFLLAGIGVLWSFIRSMPPPQPVLPAYDWTSSPYPGPPGSSPVWGKGFPKTPPHYSLSSVLLSLFISLAGLWLLGWGLLRRRPFFLERLLHRDDG
jgi:hypothetical protein